MYDYMAIFITAVHYQKNSLLPVEFLVRSHQAPYHQIFIKHKDEDQEKHWNWIHAYLIIILDKDIVFEWIPLQKKCTIILIYKYYYAIPSQALHCIQYEHFVRNWQQYSYFIILLRQFSNFYKHFLQTTSEWSMCACVWAKKKLFEIWNYERIYLCVIL